MNCEKYYYEEMKKQETLEGLKKVYERFLYDFVEDDITKEQFHRLRYLWRIRCRIVVRCEQLNILRNRKIKGV